MATLTLISEPFPGIDAEASRAASFELTRAVAATAPRGCGARLLVARDGYAPEFSSPIVAVEEVPLSGSVLPRVWHSSTTARPLDGEMVHAMTPLVPLRPRKSEDRAQTTVLVPHTLGWEAPELLGAKLARQYRGFVKRAMKHADAVLATTHAAAESIQAEFGGPARVQVMPVAPLSDYCTPPDAAERLASLALPEAYFVTDAVPGAHGRLELLFDALGAEPQLPPLVVLADASVRDTVLTQIPEALRSRVHVVVPSSLADIGAIFTRTLLLLQPQNVVGAGYEVLGALAAGIPVVHLGCPAIAELAYDAGIAAESEEELRQILSRLVADPHELSRLRVLAEDRAKSFSWSSTAWQLWEMHANL